jgi:O-antigen biosynthesis protein WbqP
MQPVNQEYLKWDSFQMSWHKRLFDILLSLGLLVCLAPLYLAIACLVKVTSRGPVLHLSKRVGTGNKLFWMPKFRSMKVDTPQIATHLLRDPRNYLTPVGRFLRRTSLDELPQLVTIFRGEMTFVGPRPALFNQDDLVNLRTEYGVNLLVPGLTGWAQVNGRDELPIPEKVQFDREYLLRRSLLFDIAIIGRTLFNALAQPGVDH